jgi:SWI/SNF-related matrix-associated actin-dependent regulator 1 of chromatin subfamily A
MSDGTEVEKNSESRNLNGNFSETSTGSSLRPIFEGDSARVGMEKSTLSGQGETTPEKILEEMKQKVPSVVSSKNEKNIVEKSKSEYFPKIIGSWFNREKPADVKIANDGTIEKAEIDENRTLAIGPGKTCSVYPGNVSNNGAIIIESDLQKKIAEKNMIEIVDDTDAFSVLENYIEKGGPFIGPRGGKWADPQHTIPWKEKKEIPTLRYNDKKSEELLIEMGDNLHEAQTGAHNVKDDTGFNQFDYDSWGSARGDLNSMRNLLRKYKRQIIDAHGDDYYHVGLADAEKKKAASVQPVYDERYGSLRLPVDGRITKKDFGSYLTVHRSIGAKFDGIERCWYIRKNDLDSFDFEAYRKNLEEIGIDVANPSGTPKKEKNKEKSGDGSTEQLNAWDVKRGIANRKITNTIAVVRHNDGKFAFYSPYNPDFNKLFSNKTGMLSGITKYNPTDHGRETHDLELVEEAIDKIKAMMPDWKIVTAGVKEARIERDQYLAELRKPIPEVQNKLNSKFALFPYQNECVRFLDKTDGNALIGDEMGLGKTLQTLAWAAKNDKKVLVVCPKVVRRTWLQEAAKFFPDHYKGVELIAADLRKKKGIDLSGVNIATVNYESLHKFEDIISEAGFDTIVVDESHRMKNPKAKITKTLQRVAADKKHKILLSGTAVKNKREELITQLDLVVPGKYTEKVDAKRRLKESTIGGLWLKMRDDYLARLKSAVLKDLPDKTTTIMTQEIKDLPDIGKDSDIGEFAKLKDQIARGKVPATKEVIQEILASSDSKILVFSDSVQTAKNIAEEFGDKALLHHGQMKDDDREAVKAEFQKQDEAGNFVSSKRIFVTTRQSMAVGATLTAADKVIFNDLPWTAADLRQAEDRVHRPGQKNAVNVYWVTAENNLFDSNISNILFRKYELAKKVNQGKQLTPEEHEWMNKTLSPKELLDQIRGLRAGPVEEVSSDESDTIGDQVVSGRGIESGQSIEARKALKPVDGLIRLGDYLEKSEDTMFKIDELKEFAKAGPFIGPRGGKWADEKHTIPWTGKEKKGVEGFKAAFEAFRRRKGTGGPENMPSSSEYGLTREQASQAMQEVREKLGQAASKKEEKKEKEKVVKSEVQMFEIDELKEFCEDLEKAQSMPEGNPKKKMGQGEEQGGKLKGKGKTSGSGNTDPGTPVNAPKPAKDKLSEDDDEEKKQMKPGKKPLERSAEKSLNPADQRERVAHETAKRISELTKSDDVVVDTVGVPAPERTRPEAPKARVWSQNGSKHFIYTDAADHRAAELAKGEDFYVGGHSPSMRGNPATIHQKIECPACKGIMAKSLSACPSCGCGITRAGIANAGSEIRLEKSVKGIGFRKATKKDININETESDE